MRSLEALRALARAYPQAYEESPWGDLAAKVNGKVFAFYGTYHGHLSLSVKLPVSSASALALEGVEPTGYGLGKHGWISADLDRLAPHEALVRSWLEESYRAVAPKRLSRDLPPGGPEPLEQPPLPTVGPDAPTVAVVTEDELRAERLIRALAHHAVHGEHSTVGTAQLGGLDAALIVVDVGRSASAAIEVAGELALECFDVPLVLAGIRDKKTLDRIAADGSDLLLSRDPPGDPRVIAMILEALGRR